MNSFKRSQNFKAEETVSVSGAKTVGMPGLPHTVGTDVVPMITWLTVTPKTTGPTLREHAAFSST